MSSKEVRFSNFLLLKIMAQSSKILNLLPVFWCDETVEILIAEKYDDCINIPMLSTDNVYQITSPGYPVEHARYTS